MKWIFFTLWVSLSSIVSPAHSQQKFSIDLSNATLKDVFNLIERQSDYVVLYTEDQLNSSRVIKRLRLKDARLDEVLMASLSGQGLAFRIAGKTIVITPAPATQQDQHEVVREVGGRVLNEKGEPVAGATVKIGSTGRIVYSDVDGWFTITGEGNNAVLTISSIGYETITVSMKPGEKLVVILKEKISQLDETVVIAYGTSLRRNLTGSVSRVTGEEIREQPVSNPLAALEGRVPGLYISQNTGVPGGSFNIQIRGINSLRFTNGNDPLYIIDGVPFTATSLSAPALSIGITRQGNPFTSINPADIESVEVLKDADATAIYGSRGANGIVLITTRKGTAGKTKGTINVYTGGGKVSRTMSLLNTQQYLMMRKEAFKNDGAVPQSYDYDLKVWDSTRYTDWQKELIGGTALVTDVQASVSGGDAHTRFIAGGGYRHESTVFPGDFALNKISGHFNVSHSSANQRFRANLSANYATSANRLPFSDVTFTSLTLPPNAPAGYDKSGNLNWENNTFNNNPYAVFARTYRTSDENLLGNLLLVGEVIKGLQVKVSAGYGSIRFNEIQIIPKSSFNPAFGLTSGFTNTASRNIRTWIIEPQITYNRALGAGRLEALVGATFQENVTDGIYIAATGFSSDALLENISAASSIQVFNNDYIRYRYNAVFARLNYNWEGKYIVNLTGRRDGSSRFGPGKRFASFGAAGAAWIFTQENFIRNALPFLSFGKLRGSYGTTGSDQIGDYQYLDTWASVTNPYQGISGLSPDHLFNPDYRWEINRKLEGALELGFLKDRILLSTSYYHNRSSDQLVGYPLPFTTGFSTIQSNLNAVVQNTGVEIVVSSGNIQRNHFTWNTSFNLTIPRNKLVAYQNLAGSPYANIYVVGKSLYLKKAFHYTGVDPQTGIYQFEDVDKDAKITWPNDLQPLKEVTQRYYGGLYNSLQYKGWKLDALLQFVRQTGFNYLYLGFLVPGLMFNQPALVMNRWQKPGDVTDVQRFTQTFGATYTAYNNASSYGDNAISDASFIRLKNITLSFSFPDAWLKKVHLKEGIIYVQGQNLFTITNYQGLDPENQTTRALPPLKMLTAGLRLTF